MVEAEVVEAEVVEAGEEAEVVEVGVEVEVEAIAMVGDVVEVLVVDIMVQEHGDMVMEVQESGAPDMDFLTLKVMKALKILILTQGMWMLNLQDWEMLSALWKIVKGN